MNENIEMIYEFLGVKTEVSATNLKTLCISNFYSNRKAREKLDHLQQPIENGIDDAIEWFKLK